MIVAKQHTGWIGGWYKEYPADRKALVDEIAAKMANDFLKEAIGLNAAHI